LDNIPNPSQNLETLAHYFGEKFSAPAAGPEDFASDVDDSSTDDEENQNEPPGTATGNKIIEMSMEVDDPVPLSAASGTSVPVFANPSVSPNN
jgi:hypothetical protein